MSSSAHSPVPTSIASPSGTQRHLWQHAARAGFLVQVTWCWLDDGGVDGEVRDLRGGDAMPFALSLAGGTPKALLMLRHAPAGQAETFIDVTLHLVRGADAIALVCNLPLDESRYLDQRIGQWRPPAPDWPDDRDDADDADDTASIQAQAQAEDLFPFVWMQPLNSAQAADAGLRFVSCPEALLQDTASMPLYAALQAATTAADKIAAAGQFRSGTQFVTALAALGQRVASMPALAARLALAEGEWPVPELTAFVCQALALPDGIAPAAYLAGAEWQAAAPRLWQSVFALGLAGTAADAALAGQVIATLRVAHLLALLPAPPTTTIAAAAAAAPADGADEATGGAPAPAPAPAAAREPSPFPPAPVTPSLQHAWVRRTLLRARVVLPDAVATQPPQPALRGATADPQARWEVLGVGQLKMARHRLTGYAPGELADVVNVMPRERQEVSERSVERHVERALSEAVQTQAQEQRQLRSASSELADSIAEVMAADGLGRNLSGVQPSYENLNMQLSGTWAGGAATSGWHSRDSAALAQRITERAARRMNDRVSQRRGQEWHALREQRRAQSIDNSGHDRLVGLYRWIDRVVQVRLETLGQRLVLEFELAQPAQPWLAQLRQATTPPLLPPPALPQPASGQPPCSVVTAESYQALGASYGLFDLEPPPAPQCTVSATLERVALGDLSVLRVPEGYQAQTAQVTLAVADGRYVVACSVGGQDVDATSPAVVPPLSAALPAYADASAAGPAQIAQPVVVQPYQKTQQLSGLALTGAVPVTVMTSAPAFAVCVSLGCVLIGGTAASPLFLAWQLRQFARLQQAWSQAQARYEAALRTRIDAAAAQPVAVQRQVLQQACIAALLPALPAAALGPRDLGAMLDAAHMTWQYLPWPLDAAPAWPLPAPGEAPHAAEQQSLQGFLRARSARVLLPVAAGWEAWLLWLLQFPLPWAGGPAEAPVLASSVPVLEALLGTAEAVPVPRWQLRVPTTLLYLQDGARLPALPARGEHQAPADAQ